MKYDYKEAMKLKNQLCFPLYAAARNVTNLYTPYLKSYGLTYTQYLVFLVLWEKDGIPVGELCEKLILDNGTISPLLKKLQQAGYVEKKRNEADDRIVHVFLTKQGRDLQKKLKDVPKKVGSCVSLEPEKAALLYSLLYELLDKNETAVKKAD